MTGSAGGRARAAARRAPPGAKAELPARIRRESRGRQPRGPATTALRRAITIQRRASNTGVIMAVGQKIALGPIHARRVVTVHVAEHTLTIDLGGGDVRTVRRTTTDPVRRVKAQRPSQPRKAAHVS